MGPGQDDIGESVASSSSSSSPSNPGPSPRFARGSGPQKRTAQLCGRHRHGRKSGVGLATGGAPAEEEGRPGDVVVVATAGRGGGDNGGAGAGRGDTA